VIGTVCVSVPAAVAVFVAVQRGTGRGHGEEKIKTTFFP
jgi:hypothetical protein